MLSLPADRKRQSVKTQGTDFQRITCVMLASCLTWGCYPGSLDTPEEADVVVTTRDLELDFGASHTFALPNNVYDLSNLVRAPIFINGAYDTLILEQFAESMAAYGWDRVDDETDPSVDMVLLLGEVVSDNLVYVGVAGFPLWGGEWGWYYPPSWQTINVPKGSIVAVMGPPGSTLAEAADGESTALPVIPAAWSVAINGVLAAGSNTENRIDAAIRQAFEQSPYLKVGEPVPPEAGAPFLPPDAPRDEDGGTQ